MPHNLIGANPKRMRATKNDSNVDFWIRVSIAAGPEVVLTNLLKTYEIGMSYKSEAEENEEKNEMKQMMEAFTVAIDSDSDAAGGSPVTIGSDDAQSSQVLYQASLQSASPVWPLFGPS